MSVDVAHLHEAHILVSKVRHLNLPVWNRLIGSYVQQERRRTAFQVFLLMQTDGVSPDNVTFLNILAACNNPLHLVRGRYLHHMILCSDCDIDVVLETALLTMYSKCWSFEDVANLFESMTFRNVVSWTVMIGAHAGSQNSIEAFHCHDQMKQESILPNRVTTLSLLEACSCPKFLVSGKHLHSCIGGPMDPNMHLLASLLHMYGKCGTIEDSLALFHFMQERDGVVWNILLAALIGHCMHAEAIQLFRSMLIEGIVPSAVTYAAIIPACVYCASSLAKNMHTYIVSNGFQDNEVIATALISLYGKLGFINTATLLFYKMKELSIVAWNSIITSCADSSDIVGALWFLEGMQCQGVLPNSITYTSSLEALAGRDALLTGKHLHCRILESVCRADIVVETALINMYFRCSAFKDGCKVFSEMPKRNLISWNTMISACCRFGFAFRGLSYFELMQREEVVPDHITYKNILSICGNQLTALTLGRALHHHIVHNEGVATSVAAVSLMDMYGKCGSLEDAGSLFNQFSKDSAVAWNVMISNYAHHGCTEQAIAIFNAMQRQGVSPNHVTFLCLLGAFSHTGMLSAAGFNSVLMGHCGIKARAEQCRCLVDLLGRAGRVEEAVRALREIPLDPSSIAWVTLLGSCRHALDGKQATHVIEHILEYETGISAAKILLATTNKQVLSVL